MTEYFTLAQFDETANAIRARSAQQPAIGLILGSGLGGLADAVERAVHIPYPELPHWPTSTVQGHSGFETQERLILHADCVIAFNSDVACDEWITVENVLMADQIAVWVNLLCSDKHC